MKTKYFVLPIPRVRFLFIIRIRFFKCNILKLLDKAAIDLSVWANPNK